MNKQVQSLLDSLAESLATVPACDKAVQAIHQIVEPEHRYDFIGEVNLWRYRTGQNLPPVPYNTA